MESPLLGTHKQVPPVVERAACFFPLRALPGRGYKSSPARAREEKSRRQRAEHATGIMGSQQDGDATAGEVVYLHGVLEATVFEAEHLRNAVHGRIMQVNLAERTHLADLHAGLASL